MRITLEVSYDRTDTYLSCLSCALLFVQLSDSFLARMRREPASLSAGLVNSVNSVLDEG